MQAQMKVFIDSVAMTEKSLEQTIHWIDSLPKNLNYNDVEVMHLIKTDLSIAREKIDLFKNIVTFSQNVLLKYIQENKTDQILKIIPSLRSILNSSVCVKRTNFAKSKLENFLQRIENENANHNSNLNDNENSNQYKNEKNPSESQNQVQHQPQQLQENERKKRKAIVIDTDFKSFKTDSKPETSTSNTDIQRENAVKEGKLFVSDQLDQFKRASTDASLKPFYETLLDYIRSSKEDENKFMEQITQLLLQFANSVKKEDINADDYYIWQELIDQSLETSKILKIKLFYGIKWIEKRIPFLKNHSSGQELSSIKNTLISRNHRISTYRDLLKQIKEQLNQLINHSNTYVSGQVSEGSKEADQVTEQILDSFLELGKELYKNEAIGTTGEVDQIQELVNKA